MNRIGEKSRYQYIKSQIYYYHKHNTPIQQILLKYYLFITQKYKYVSTKDPQIRENIKQILQLLKTPLFFEKKILLESSATGISFGNSDITHLSNLVAVSNYIRIADEIKSFLPDGKAILDWGCGYGQMTYLLRNRQLKTLAYDITRRDNIEKIHPFSEINIIYGKPSDDRLPFENESFDAVLSCGTLEHVLDAEQSLKEIHRVLKPAGGLLFIYMLPNKYGWSETLATIRGISSHPVKYTAKKVKNFLNANNFRIIRFRRRNFLPKNLTGMPLLVKKIYGEMAGVVILLDKILSSIPLLNLLCGTFEIVARKEK